MEHLTFSLVAFVSYLITVTRVLTYRRMGARHRWHASWFAWVILAGSGVAAIDLVVRPYPVGLIQALAAVCVAAVTLRARGNLARVLWSK